MLLSPAGVGRGTGQVDVAEGGTVPCPSRTRSRKVAVASWSWVPRRPGRCRRGWCYTVSESDTAFSLEVARVCSRSLSLCVRVGHAPGRLPSPGESWARRRPRSMPPRVALHRVRVGHRIQTGGRQGLLQVAEPSCLSRTRSRKVAATNWRWYREQRPGSKLSIAHRVDTVVQNKNGPRVEGHPITSAGNLTRLRALSQFQTALR